eukprot:jgi/Orpsp1_1/1188468/evm.model.d7180000065079.1
MDDDEFDKKLEKYDYKSLDMNILSNYKYNSSEIIDENEIYDYHNINEKENDHNILNNDNKNSSVIDEKDKESLSKLN